MLCVTELLWDAQVVPSISGKRVDINLLVQTLEEWGGYNEVLSLRLSTARLIDRCVLLGGERTEVERICRGCDRPTICPP